MTDKKVNAEAHTQMEAIYLFNRKKLTQLSIWTEIDSYLQEKNLQARPLTSSDHENGYLELLSHLPVVGVVTKDDFIEIFNSDEVKNGIEEYAIVVVEDLSTKKVVGAASLVVELKFIHQCARRGLLRHVVVHDDYRGKKIGDALVKLLVGLAKEIFKCYKITLECDASQKKFFKGIGFKDDKNVLSISFQRYENKLCSLTNQQFEDVCLFNSEKLFVIPDWLKIDTDLKQKNLQARPLKVSDYENGYLDLLSQLTKVGEITKDDFLERFNLMKARNGVDTDEYAIVVIEDTNNGKAVGAASLVIEPRFVNQCALISRVEEVVVLDEYRGKKIGETVVKILIVLAKEVYRCSKVSLDCKDGLIKFYNKNGFVQDKNLLSLYFNK